MTQHAAIIIIVVAPSGVTDAQRALVDERIRTAYHATPDAKGWVTDLYDLRVEPGEGTEWAYSVVSMGNGVSETVDDPVVEKLVRSIVNDLGA